jgi:hypothetical protein
VSSWTPARAHHERQLRRARRTTAVLAGLLVVALVAGGLALVQRATARRQEVIARSTGLAAQASARRESEPDLALLLAVEGHRLDDSIQTRGGLLDTLGQSPQLAALHQGYGELTSVDLSPDETTLAARTVDGHLRLWDFRTRAPKTPPIDTGQDKGDVAFSPDGRLVATSGDDGSVRLWDAARGTPVGAVMRHQPGGAASMRFSPTGGGWPRPVSKTAARGCGRCHRERRWPGSESTNWGPSSRPSARTAAPSSCPPSWPATWPWSTWPAGA